MMSVRRYGRPVAFALAVVLCVLAMQQLIVVSQGRPALLASDLVKGYLPGAQRFLDTGSPYLPEQVAGTWTLGFHSFIHPPAALPIFVPFLVLPLALWWAIPIGVTALAIWRLRPASWTWPLMALCLCWPRSTGSLLAGNSDIWAMTAVAAGAVWGWPAVMLLAKPTFAPLGLVAVKHRSTWVAAFFALLFVLATIPLWVEWSKVISNAGLQWWYSLLNLPLVALPLIAYLGRDRDNAGRALSARPRFGYPAQDLR